MDEIADWRKEWPSWKMALVSDNLTYKSKALNAAVKIWLDEYFNIDKSLSLVGIKRDYEKMVQENPKLEAMDADGVISYICLHERGLVSDYIPDDIY